MEEWVKRDSVLIEKVYSKGIFPIVIKGLNGLSGSVPFSLFEAVLCVLLLFILAALGVLAWQAGEQRTGALEKCRTAVFIPDHGLRDPVQSPVGIQLLPPAAFGADGRNR